MIARQALSKFSNPVLFTTLSVPFLAGVEPPVLTSGIRGGFTSFPRRDVAVRWSEQAVGFPRTRGKYTEMRPAAWTGRINQTGENATSKSDRPTPRVDWLCPLRLGGVAGME